MTNYIGSADNYDAINAVTPEDTEDDVDPVENVFWEHDEVDETSIEPVYRDFEILTPPDEIINSLTVNLPRCCGDVDVEVIIIPSTEIEEPVIVIDDDDEDNEEEDEDEDDDDDDEEEDEYRIALLSSRSD